MGALLEQARRALAGIDAARLLDGIGLYGASISARPMEPLRLGRLAEARAWVAAFEPPDRAPAGDAAAGDHAAKAAHQGAPAARLVRAPPDRWRWRRPAWRAPRGGAISTRSGWPAARPWRRIGALPRFLDERLAEARDLLAGMSPHALIDVADRVSRTPDLASAFEAPGFRC